jgi:hypothetical protein
VVVQGGAYAEHRIVRVRSEAVEDGAAEGVEGMLLGRAMGGRRANAAGPAPEPVEVAVDHPHVSVRLAPGAGARLTLTLERYANRPTFAFPWA